MGEYPIYLPDDHPFTAKVVFKAHLSTLHGGVGFTMAKVREKYWVPRLRRLVKKLKGSCHGCKRFRARAFQVPPSGSLPKTRTEGSRPFQVIGYVVSFPPKFNVPFYIVLNTIYPTFRVCHLSLHSRFNFFSFNIQLSFMQHSSFCFRHSTFHKQQSSFRIPPSSSVVCTFFFASNI